jgi:Tfp pilus assembly protein PilF
MADDSDLARLLPDSPPPRPAARDAAIAAAMRRFDGVSDPTPAAAPARRPTRWVSGKQIGAFASIILVAGISLSIALNRPGGLQPGKVEQPPADIAPRSAPAPDRPGVSKPPATSAAKESTPAVKPEPPIQKPTAPAAPVTLAGGADRRASEDLARSASPPPPPSPAPPAAMAPPPMQFAPRSAAPPPPADESPVAAAGRVAQPKAIESASPVSMASKKADEDEGPRDVVVTGARRRPNAYAARGDWNACTVIDPEESLRGCKSVLGIGAKGPAGEAAARLANGLALAWRGDLDGAIAAFDQAIALKPRFAFAYLNRGLAYQRQGEPARAAADLDLAIKYAPYAARGYYNRSVLRREQGNRRGADADANRAVQLDLDYPDPAQ